MDTIYNRSMNIVLYIFQILNWMERRTQLSIIYEKNIISIHFPNFHFSQFTFQKCQNQYANKGSFI